MSQKKIMFFVIAAILVISLGIGFSLLSGEKKTGTTAGAKEITVWVVGDDRVGFDPIISEFKKNAQYKDTTVTVTKFATYADYERSLLSVIADGKSPDIFVVPSTGAAMLESQIVPLSDSVVDMDDFSKNLNKLFDPLIDTQPGKSEDGKDIQIRSIKGIPLGYETIGAFYNRSLVSGGVPATWQELQAQNLTTEEGATLPVALGYGSRYITQAPSLATLFMVQAGIDSVSRLQDPLAVQAIEDYQGYAGSTESPDATNTNALYQLKDELDRKSISTTDLFVRGKVGAIFGYPSLLREIEYSEKRAGTDSKLEKRDLRSSPIPQGENGKKSNLVRFQYFALSKTAAAPEAGIDFLSHLSLKSSTESYLDSFPHYLPARNDLVEIRKEKVMNKNYPWVRYESFLPSSEIRLINFDRVLTSEYEAVLGKELDQPLAEAKNILLTTKKRVECIAKQLIERKGYEESCSE